MIKLLFQVPCMLCGRGRRSVDSMAEARMEGRGRLWEGWDVVIFENFPDILHTKILHSPALGCAASAYKTNENK